MAKTSKTEAKKTETKTETKAQPRPATQGQAREIVAASKELAQGVAQAVKEEKSRAKRAARQDAEGLVTLREALVKTAKDAGLVVEQTGGFLKLMSPKQKKLRISLARRGGQVFTVGFTGEGCLAISEAQAKERHIGHARGELDLTETPEPRVREIWGKLIAAVQVATALALLVQ